MTKLGKVFLESLGEGWALFWRVAFSPVFGLISAIAPFWNRNHQR
ncbi:hypothetical protein EDC30_110114 [Paucimonas lemoignei]|uniref:Uncharacterized protein n=1 Tax=Paucimonas lemoignei TaxID=29443 RepID=A0A4R3HUG2_PAULE|nr:hypothetical protein EDC30_110114 [Paucimonas lemoignei]